MSQFKFIIPAKVTDDGKFDTSDLLKKKNLIRLRIQSLTKLKKIFKH